MFKKTLAAVAVGMVAFGAQAAEFTAGETVFQVNLDATAEVITTKAAVGDSTTFNGAGQIQLKANRKVTDDLNVFAQLEVDFDPIVDNSPVLSDDVKIGLASKSFGTLTVGQFDTYMEDQIAEALGYWNPANGDLKVTEPTVGNDGRQIQYIGKMGDFKMALSVNSSNAASATGEQFLGQAAVLGYESGPFRAYVGTSTLPKYKSDTFALNTVKTASGVSGYYTFGTTTVSVMGIKTTSTAELDTNYAGVGVFHVMGEYDLGAALQTKTVNTSATASTTTSEWSIVGGYTVTKGTKFYVGALGLGATNGVGDLMVFGLTTSF